MFIMNYTKEEREIYSILRHRLVTETPSWQSCKIYSVNVLMYLRDEIVLPSLDS